MADLEVLPLEEVDRDELLQVINLAFGAPRPADWFEWKYRLGPWGPASGVVAVDRGTVVGLRALLPWQMVGDGRPFMAARAIEASTVPAAQGRGIFSLLNRTLMERAAAEGSVQLIYSTPNESSRPGYAKLGWSVTPALTNHYCPVLPRRVVGVELGDATVAGPPPVAARGCATAWTSESWRWRFDPRSGREYRGARLDGAEANGLVYRVVAKRSLAVLSVLALWGRPEDRRRLLGAAAHRERAVAVLLLRGPGSAVAPTLRGLGRPTSTLAYWNAGDPAVVPPGGGLDAFRLWPADVEGAI